MKERVREVLPERDRGGSPAFPSPAQQGIAQPGGWAYFGTMRKSAKSEGRLPTTLGFSPVEDRARMPGRFFYRQISAVLLTR
ncbi:hypothetical protein [Aureimonas ureilytica]|uniref:hypothetical protein n=1 Tax=Aureimonas ureilytica TaxID=401562 RepID=UPI000AF286AF|nr:hypothetical protein [Aureimonas ureilytica]